MFAPFVVLFLKWPLSRIMCGSMYSLYMCVFSEPISWNPMQAMDEKQDIKLLWPYVGIHVSKKKSLTTTGERLELIEHMYVYPVCAIFVQLWA